MMWRKGGVFAHLSPVSVLLLVGDGVRSSCLEGVGLHGLAAGEGSGMEALKSSFRREAAAPQQNHGPSSEETAWIVEKGEGFSVDELLNLGEFGNIESAEENEEEVKEAKAEQVDTENDCNVTATISSSPSSSGSALSCEAPPLLPSSISEISLPSHDVEELEWVSFIIDDSSLEFPAGDAPFDSFLQAQTESDDSASCERRHQLHIAAAATQGARAPIPCSTVCALPIEAPVPARAKRSKRSRTVAVGWSSLPFADSFSTTTATTATSVSSCSSASSSLSSCLIYDHSVTASDQSLLLHGSHRSLPPSLPEPTKRKVPKKRSRKPNHSSAFVGAGAVPPSGERRCSHCGVQKTPQWRAGPLGAKTLCNACGVRFKSGRLLPEYRPACSPTFQNAIHSNSHRKVLEMRRKKEFLAAAGPPVATC